MINVLFLCTGNSARSIIAESLMNALGAGRFRGYSAGSHPGGSINPFVAEFLAARGMLDADARSKPWDEFAGAGAPRMDLVITVCDQAAGEACPVWPGHPARAHWSAPDPAAHMNDPARAREVVAEVFQLMKRRIGQLVSVPVDRLTRDALEEEARRIADATQATPAGR